MKYEHINIYTNKAPAQEIKKKKLAPALRNWTSSSCDFNLSPVMAPAPQKKAGARGSGAETLLKWILHFLCSDMCMLVTSLAL